MSTIEIAWIAGVIWLGFGIGLLHHWWYMRRYRDND